MVAIEQLASSVSFNRETAGGVAKDLAKLYTKGAVKKAALWLVGLLGLPVTLLILLIMFIALVVPLAVFTKDIFTPYGSTPYGYYDGGMGFGLSPILGSWTIVPGGEYGAARDYGAHEGVDLAAPLGTPVVAVAAGVINFAETPLGGMTIFLNGDDGRVYVYMHLGEREGYSGMRVKVGDVIGRVGMTGRTSGPHLHFEVRVNGRPVDPMPFIKGVVAPEELLYREIDVNETIDWITGYLHGSSLLATPENINTLINVGRQFNINPNLLIAITGQEQSFVPAGSNPRILGNPFNVYGSWENYSPGLEPSAKIAARTIVSLSQGRPESTHPIYWLNCPGNPNGMYATDPGWWRGVTKFFDALQKT